MKTSSLFLFGLGIMLFPFYLYSSGQPQPAHYVFLCGAVAAVLSNRRLRSILRTKMALALLSFVLYVVVVNLSVALQFHSFEPIVFAAYYIFNAIVFFGLVSVGLTAFGSSESEKFWKYLLLATLASLFVQATMGVLDLGKQYHTYRSILFFNNPNQLGYFAVASTSILFIAQRYRTNSQLWIMSGYVMALYCGALSMSKAALVSLFAFPLFYLLGGKAIGSGRIFALALAFVVIFVGAGLMDEDITSKLEHRLSSMGTQEDDSLEGRAYDRLWKFPQYLLFGAGEGVRPERFGAMGEIHSLPATILFSYGIIGSLIFGYFFWLIYRQVGVQPFMQIFPVLMYNLTHNGVRSPMFWIILGLMFVGGVSQVGKREARGRKTQGLMGAKVRGSIRKVGNP